MSMPGGASLAPAYRRPGKRSATGQKKALHRRAFSSGFNIRHIAFLL